MSAWLPPGLRHALRLKVRGSFRDGLRRARTPSGALAVVLGALFLGGWLLPVIWLPPGAFRPISATALATVGPPGLLVAWLGQVALRGGGEALGFEPAEADQLFGGPYSPEQLLRYKVTLLLVAWTLGGVLLAPMAMCYAEHPLGGTLAVLLLLPFLQLSAMITAMIRRGRGRSPLRRALFLVGVVVLGVGALVAAPRGAEAWTGLAALQAHPVAWAVLLPFRAGVGLLTSTTPGDVLASAGIVLAFDVALVAVLLRLGRGAWLEIALDGAQHTQATAEAYRSGGGVSALGGWWRWHVPRLPWWGGVGPVAWRRTVEIVRRPAALGSFAGVAALVLGIGVFVAWSGVSADRRGTAFAMGLALLVWGDVMLPGVLRLDFRADLDRMERLIVLPVRPLALVVGQVLPMAVLLTLFVWCALAGVVAWHPPAWRLALVAAGLQPALALVVLAVENALFLWFPVRLEVGEAALQSVGRQLVISLVGWGVQGAAVATSAIAAVVAYAATAGWLAAAWLAGLAPMLLVLGVALAAASVRVARFDPSVHVPR